MTRTPPLLWLAAGLTLLALGLPWTSAMAGHVAIPGWLGPGICGVVYDSDGWASTECTGWYDNSLNYGGHPALPGFATGIRVFVLVAVLLVVLGQRRQRPRLQQAGLAVAAAGLLIHRGSLPGQLAYLAALLVAAGAILFSHARRESRIGRASRTPGTPSPVARWR